VSPSPGLSLRAPSLHVRGDALLFNVKVQVFVLLPLLEQAPDQTASRLFETLNVIDVPVANDADPVPPTAPSALKASS